MYYLLRPIYTPRAARPTPRQGYFLFNSKRRNTNLSDRFHLTVWYERPRSIIKCPWLEAVKKLGHTVNLLISITHESMFSGGRVRQYLFTTQLNNC